MKLTAEQIQANWEEFCENIETYISRPRRKEALLWLFIIPIRNAL